MENSVFSKILINVVFLHMKIIAEALHTKRAPLPVMFSALIILGGTYMCLLPEDNLLSCILRI